MKKKRDRAYAGHNYIQDMYRNKMQELCRKLVGTVQSRLNEGNMQLIPRMKLGAFPTQRVEIRCILI